ncbi:hypothetical protein MMC25_001129 [Agyrium rufum]|nr:hypothetical protein [Agyrium rufum]
MPYNTRRKSLSLPALGIQLPSASRAHRPSLSKSSVTVDPEAPPSKRAKRSHGSTSPSPITPSRPRSSTASSSKSVTFAERPKSSGRAAYEHTPPPSPGANDHFKIDFKGIHDDIVTGVIEQLEKTGNRPHLIKELATVLSTTSNAVARYVDGSLSQEIDHPRTEILTQLNSSANPAALLSSRLAAYIKRPCWSALAPCPLGKELIPIHPRKVYYYLTTTKRQEFPYDTPGFPASPVSPSVHIGGKVGKRIISPSLSNASVDEDMESAEERKRQTMSPSPEVDLSPPEPDLLVHMNEDDLAPPIPGSSSFSSRSSLARDGSVVTSSEVHSLTRSQRGGSPPLEVDEKEFTQTARGMREREMSMGDLNIQQSREIDLQPASHADETEEEKAKRNSEAVATLFGDHHHHQVPREVLTLMSSPMVHASHATLNMVPLKAPLGVNLPEPQSMSGDFELGSNFIWDIQKPEQVDLDELDAMLLEF